VRFHYVEQNGNDDAISVPIRRSDGSMGGCLDFHQVRSADGSVRAQFELRFEDQSSLVTIAETGMDDARYEAGRSWVLVEMEPRKSFSEPVRFSIHIPGPAINPSVNIGDVKTAAAEVRATREAVQKVRSRCGNSHGCYYPVCDMDADRTARQLADDGCVSGVVSLAAFTLHPFDPSSQRPDGSFG